MDARGLAVAASLLAHAALSPPEARALDAAMIDVQADRAVAWARADAPGPLVFELRAAESGPGMLAVRNTVAVDAASDLTGSIRFSQLAPDRAYLLHVSGPADAERELRFRTPPAATTAAPVRIAFGGDVSGQNVCRDTERGFVSFAAVASRQPDAFLGLGDMIYADGICEATGRYGNAQVPGPPTPAREIEGFRARWRYNRDDVHWRALMADTPYVPVWDDHEVINDFGPYHDAPADAPDLHLLPDGIRAFLEYNPIARADQPRRLHRSLRYGQHVQMFLLDTRQHRDPNSATDGLADPKSMLGLAQREWLEAALLISDATWKVIVSSVPISIPTGADDPTTGRDGWSGYGQETGFQQELGHLLAYARQSGVRNLLWLTTDVHFASVFAYQPFGDDFRFHEVVVGPLNAGLFPKVEFDRSLRPERLFFHGPPSPEAVTSFDDALTWFNWGLVEVDAAGALTLSVIDARGHELYSKRLEPEG